MSFDRIAPHYRWMEAVLAGRSLQRCRTAFLPDAGRVQKALFLGEGNGRSLVPFRRHNPDADVVFLEASRNMIALARSNLARRGLLSDKVEFIHADALEWSYPQSEFDLIVSHFFLDCFTTEQLETLIPRLAASARPSALWLIADFQEPSGRLPRWRAKVIIWMMYLFFRRATALPARRLTPPEPFLMKAGLTLVARSVRQYGLLRSDCWQARPKENVDPCRDSRQKKAPRPKGDSGKME